MTESNKRIPEPGDLVTMSDSKGLWYVTYRNDYTISLMQVAPKFGEWVITDISDIDKVMAPDHWNMTD